MLPQRLWLCILPICRTRGRLSAVDLARCLEYSLDVGELSIKGLHTLLCFRVTGFRCVDLVSAADSKLGISSSQRGEDERFSRNIEQARIIERGGICSSEVTC
jgi:hypothetical protein